jgi:hypothetical protein
LRKTWRHCVRAHIELPALEREQTEQIVAGVVDRKSYLRALAVAALSECQQIAKGLQKPMPYRYEGLWPYGGRSGWIESDALVTREICLAKLDDERCRSRWAKRRRRNPPMIDKLDPHDAIDIAAPSRMSDGAHGWQSIVRGNSGWAKMPCVSVGESPQIRELVVGYRFDRHNRKAGSPQQRFAHHFSWNAMRSDFLVRLDKAEHRLRQTSANPGSPRHVRTVRQVQELRARRYLHDRVVRALERSRLSGAVVMLDSAGNIRTAHPRRALRKALEAALDQHARSAVRVRSLKNWEGDVYLPMLADENRRAIRMQDPHRNEADVVRVRVISDSVHAAEPALAAAKP